VSAARETLRITASMAVACAIGAAILGAVYAATDRYQRAAALRGERTAVAELLAVPPDMPVLEVRQALVPSAGEVVYGAAPLGATTAPREFAFTLDGAPASVPPPAAKRVPLGRMFVARRGGAPVGFVVEGSARGYKNRIRFLVALSPGGAILGVRVVEHEEDPGLGAEVATPLFQAQFAGRDSAAATGLDVTRDPMPEDWRVALGDLRRMPAGTWETRYGALAHRERGRPVYAVTGATISSRALTLGVRQTVDHFRRRWALIGPHLGVTS
jgi:H+/Na+-translocating ferredoxin:NAD+ oxidoreductase subunit G